MTGKRDKPEMKKETLKRPYLIRVLVLVGVIIGLGFLAKPAFAQDAERMHELQRVIEAQQKQLEEQQKQLDAQRLG